MKKISQYKVKKRCVVLKLTQAKFPQGSNHELTMVKQQTCLKKTNPKLKNNKVEKNVSL